MKYTCYSASTAFFAFWFTVSAVIVFLLAFVQADTLTGTGQRYGAKNGISTSTDYNEQNPVCGTIKISDSESVTLREGISISVEDFQKVYNGNLTNALFSPVTERHCAIQLCGFSSYGTPYRDEYIGSTGDYADCNMILRNKTAGYLPLVYNGNFSASAINCGCTKRSEDCMFTCAERASALEKAWGENGCAALFQEDNCNSCYLNPVYIGNGQTFSTNNSHHIRSMLVRDQCTVKQNIPALKRMFRFFNLPQPFIYDGEPTPKNVKSAFQNEPEHFHCICGETPVTTTTESPPTPPPYKPAKYNNILFISSLVVGATLIVFIAAFILVMWKRRNSRNSNILPEPCFEGGNEKGHFNKKNFGSNESSMTHLTNLTSVDNGVINDDEDDTLVLGDMQIQNMRFNPAFETLQDHVKVGKPLAEGRFGQVFEGTLKVAIKKVKAISGAEEKDSLKQEIKILAHLGSHENVVRLLGYTYEEDDLSLIIELCENGSLKGFLTSPEVKGRVLTKRSEYVISRSNFGEGGYAKREEEYSGTDSHKYDLSDVDPEMLSQMYKWIYQIASGMQYIQSKNIIHVDLATRNVLLTHKLVAKIGDFGLAKKMYIKNYVDSRKDSLPLRWIAPETLSENYKCSKSSDVWSFGVTVWEIFSLGDDPYADKHQLQVMNAILKKEKLECPEFAPPDVYSKMLECWNDIPDERPTFESLQLHFYLRLPTEPDYEQVISDDDQIEEMP